MYIQYCIHFKISCFHGIEVDPGTECAGTKRVSTSIHFYFPFSNSELYARKGCWNNHPVQKGYYPPGLYCTKLEINLVE